MRRAPERIFILENGKYIEIGYEDFQKLKAEDSARCFWMFGGMLLEVPAEIYIKMNREKSRHQYLKELSKRFGEFSYDSLATDEFDGEMILVDNKSDVHQIVEEKLLVDKLHHALDMLTEEENKIIQALFFEELTERQYATEQGVSQTTIHKKKQRILKKLKNLL